MRAELLTKGEKITIMFNYWDLMFGTLQQKASKIKDADVNELCKKLIVVPQAIKYKALEYYVDKCREVHAIAFLQWRKMFPNDLRYDIEELDELITSRVRNLHKNFAPNTRITYMTKELAKVPKDFSKTYKLIPKEKKVF